MASSNARTKAQVNRMLTKTAFDLERTAESWAVIPEILELPEALYATAKFLPLLSIMLGSLKAFLESSEETDVLKGKYPAIYQFAERCQKRVDYLDSIFDAITGTEGSTGKGEKYRIAAEEYGGLGIEAVMKDLLQRAKTLAALVQTDNDLKSRLQEAFEEVNKLKPSLAQTQQGIAAVNHYGKGNQFYHGGRGNQNQCDGGVQFTGDNAKYYSKTE